MIEDISFNYLDQDGNNKQYIIVEKVSINNKNIIIYKEKDLDELYAAFYEIIDDKIKIIPIEKEEDYDIVDKYLESI